MTHPTRSTRMRIETPRLCDRCGDPFVGPKGCRKTLYESECVPRPEPLFQGNEDPTMVPCPRQGLQFCEECGAPQPYAAHRDVPDSVRRKWREDHGHPKSSVPADRFDPPPTPHEDPETTRKP